MSNQRKPRMGKRRGTSRFKRTMMKGLDERRNFPLHDDSNPLVQSAGLVNVSMPENDVEVIKEVPAMHTGLPGGEHAGEKVEVGTAYIHSDSSIGLRYHEDAPVWAMEEIQAFADKVGYSLGEGKPIDGSA